MRERKVPRIRIEDLDERESQDFSEHDLRRVLGGSSPSAFIGATPGMQEMNMSFNLTLLNLQSQMQNESRQYTALSNILK